MKHLFSGVAGVAIAASLAAAAPAEAQSRSPVPSGMQPQSTFTPPPGTTMYRQDSDGRSTPVSREEFLRGTQQSDSNYQQPEPNYQQSRQNNYQYQGYEQQQNDNGYQPLERQSDQELYDYGRAQVAEEYRSQREADDYYSRNRADFQVGCAATFNGGSWYNQGQAELDSRAGNSGREFLSDIERRAANRTADAQDRCRVANSTPYARGQYRQHIEERTIETGRNIIRDALGLRR